MANIKDVARIAGVSVASVSRVLNNGPKVSQKTIDKVNKVMAELDYTPNANARALVTQKSSTMGVVIPHLTDPFFASLANGVEKVAHQNNMQLLISTSLLDAETELKAINLLIERRCDVIVAHCKMIPDETVIALTKKVPGLVLINRYIEEIAHRCVWIDNLEGGRIAARHLLSLNHKTFACISSKYDIDDPQLRLDGFQQELACADINTEKTLIEYGNPDLQGGEIATQKLLASEVKFSALFVYNDAMAIGAISTLEENGLRVPQDISVIGFDDVLLSRYSRPKLTTLNYPIEEMAMKAATLAKRLTNKGVDVTDQEQIKVIPDLIKRDSTCDFSN